MLELLALEPECFYWARRRETGGAWEVVQISTVFGAGRDYWTVARTGSDVHQMVDDYEFLVRVALPEAAMISLSQAAE
ncbi:hypothetical protein AM571_PA00064 (plasmid) [Rhizobium etli 8C-3]|uniref:Uncharacterized protein n=1 Tax=Rhizobium etli 8C-3 TaxID=538025 RepID=A0A1L5PA52_RHIET|nr:hypothetical protein [Rhizobium etli]APO76952.1 hypothetical protein AM571_PA00064 [Rhizobium etli 8C-3]